MLEQDILKSELVEKIQDIGGKHGVLEYLRQTYPDISPHIPPSVLVKAGDFIKNDKEKSFWNFLKKQEIWQRNLSEFIIKNGTTDYIMRTSNVTDWDGMVDTMPTEIIRTDVLKQYFRREKYLLKVMREMVKQASLTELINYANIENPIVPYDPNNVTISLSELVTQHSNTNRYTLTEDPNNKERIFYDKERSDIPAETDSTMLNIYSINTDSLLINLIKKIRSKNIFSEDIALQYEMSNINGKAYLHQIRKFSNNKKANFELDKSTPLLGRYFKGRIFGVTSEKGVLINPENIEYEDDFYGKKKGITVIDKREGLRLSDIVSKELKCVFFTNVVTLNHSTTRAVQSVLRNSDGVAVLGVREHNGDNEISNFLYETKQQKSPVRFICDGKNFQLKKA